MSDPSPREAQTERDEVTSRVSVLSARSHVGAAGFAQGQALEAIITAGHEQIALTHALREVVVTTQTQLRDIALRYDREVADVHTGALKDVVRSG